MSIINHPRGRYCYCHTMSMNGEVVGREGITSREEAEEGELGRGGRGGGGGGGGKFNGGVVVVFIITRFIVWRSVS